MTEFRYYKDLVRVKAKYAYYVKLEKELQAKGDHYGAWMCTRRQGQWNTYRLQQENNEHEIAIIVDGALVCVCGLIDDTGLNESIESDREAFLAGPGHVDRR